MTSNRRMLRLPSRGAAVVVLATALFSLADETAAQPEPVVLRGIVVDESGAAVGNATIVPLQFGFDAARENVKSDAAGRFTLPLRREAPANSNPSSVSLIAWDESGMRQAYLANQAVGGANGNPAEVRIVLQKAREIPVTVHDSRGKPIPGAGVAGTIEFHRTMRVTSDQDGKAILRVPAAATLQYAFAVMPDMGLDYFVFAGDGEKEETLKQAGPLSFVLAGTRFARVRIVDGDGKPMPDVSVYPWYVQRPKKGTDFNMSGVRDFTVRTDAAGVAEFRFIPADTEQKITFWAHREGYFAPERGMFDPRGAADEISVTLVAMVPVRGKAMFADGRAAAGASIIVRGAGYHVDSFQGTTACGDDGSFEIRVNPDEYVAFAANSGRFVSNVESRIVLAGKPPEPIELVLREGTRVHGRATTVAKKEPAPGEYVSLYRRDDSYYQLPPEKRLPNPTRSNQGISTFIIRSATTDAEGRFEFFAGPGKYYTIGPQGADPVNFDLTDQAEFELSLSVPRLRDLAGRVVLKADPARPVAEAVVEGAHMAASRYGRWLRTATDRQGMFRGTQLAPTAMLVYARSEGGLLAGIAQIAEDDSEVTVAVSPTGTARGRLVDQQGLPLADRQIDYGVRVTQREKGGLETFSNHFGGSARTNALGEFVLPGLARGWKFDLNVVRDIEADGSPRGWSTARGATVETEEILELGDVQLARSTPRSVKEGIVHAMISNGTVDDRLAARLGEARLLERRVLLVAVAKSGPAAERFFGMYLGEVETPPLVRRALAEHVLLAIDTTQGTARDAAMPLLRKLGLDFSDGWESRLAILDTEGRLIAQASEKDLSSEGELSSARLFEFLKKHSAVPNAQRLLADALAEARRDDKRVLLVLSSPLSARCRLLWGYLDRHREILAKDYVFVKVDARAVDGEAVIRRLRTEGTDVPWMAILDAEGKPLSTSAGPAGDIGYPMTAAEIAHWEKMLRSTARRLTADEIRSLLEGLH